MTQSLDELLDTAREHLAGWRFEAARQALRSAYTATRTDSTPGAEATAAQIAVLYGEVLRDTNQLTTAINILEPLAADLHTRRGPDDPLTVQAYAVLGAVYHDLGHLDHAQRCYQQVLTSRASPHSPAGRAIRRTAANLAFLHHDQGDHEQALRELTAAHAAIYAYQGAANVDTLHIAAELAALLHAHGHTDQAQQLLHRSLHHAQAGLAGDHPLIALLGTDLRHLTTPASRHRRHTPPPAAPAAQQHRSPWQPANLNRTGA
ncbi:tetratricopeptide repeat protein [Dactylosporangium sp. NPDC000555]|uniref:tetratricopeptide repeat protein n=1 Tax=Dactylosporangium sp. NPDC000555 TaxID=3154260 RepID=UPI00333126EC